MPHSHNDWQARADSMRGFFERSKADVVRMQAGRARLDAEYREARDAMRWQLAHVKRTEAQKLHVRIVKEMDVLNSIQRVARINQTAADHQNAAKRVLQAAE